MEIEGQCPECQTTIKFRSAYSVKRLGQILGPIMKKSAIREPVTEKIMGTSTCARCRAIVQAIPLYPTGYEFVAIGQAEVSQEEVDRTVLNLLDEE